MKSEDKQRLLHFCSILDRTAESCGLDYDTRAKAIRDLMQENDLQRAAIATLEASQKIERDHLESHFNGVTFGQFLRDGQRKNSSSNQPPDHAG